MKFLAGLLIGGGAVAMYYRRGACKRRCASAAPTAKAPATGPAEVLNQSAPAVVVNGAASGTMAC